MLKAKTWSEPVGKRPFTVRVCERKPGGMIYRVLWDNGKQDWKSLGHRDKDEALAYAHELSAKRRRGLDDIPGERVTLARVFSLYAMDRTPDKGASERQEDARRTEMWGRCIGDTKDPHKVGMRECDRFVKLRRTGKISSRGELVPEVDRRPVGNTTVGHDLRFLNAVFNWAAKWRDDSGEYLMRENPLRGYAIPREKNPRRPFVTQDRLDALRAVSDQVTMEIRRHGKRTPVRSYLSELLDIADGTGRRRRSILELRYEDLRLNDSTEHGSICWPYDTDKNGYEDTVVINAQTRDAIDLVIRKRPGIGKGYLFPSPGDPSKPVDGDCARRWLLECEELAGLVTQDGSLWHAIRRKWVIERMHNPVAHVAMAGGWRTVQTVLNIYQQHTTEGVQKAVNNPKRVYRKGA